MVVYARTSRRDAWLYPLLMQCARHGIAAGPGGRCVLCQRREQELARVVSRGRDVARAIAIVVVALMAALATFALVGALADTR